MEDNKKPYNGGEWTEARYHSFVKSALRSASVKWPPRYQTLHESYAGVRLNPKSGRMAKHYQCNCCKALFPAKDVQVNHIDPVIPIEGFTTWDEVVRRMYCEKEGLEVLCKPCHKEITKEENEARKAHKNG